MATTEQKEELMQTLKFTPRKYHVDVWGYGGEVYYGAVERKIYDFFKEKEIDIEQYAGSWDEEMWEDIPNDMRPFDPGSPYDVGGVHESGATVDETSYITVYDENKEQVWQSSLNPTTLATNGVRLDCYGEFKVDEHPEGTVVFWGAQGEKGLFFGNDFELTAPFDPKKLRLTYIDVDGWELSYSVEYDGVEIDGYDYDTSGKWSEAKWIIVGDTEEVYYGTERDEEDYEDTSDDDEELDLEDDEDATDVDDESNSSNQGG